ncbi:hypothetical protein JCM11251_001362 [Rhodosporidiobolus azoricus]
MPPAPPTPLATTLGLFISDAELLSLVNDDREVWPRHIRQGAQAGRAEERYQRRAPAAARRDRAKKESRPPKRLGATSPRLPVCGLSPTEANGRFFLEVVEEDQPPEAALRVPPSLLSLRSPTRLSNPSFQPVPPSSPILIPLDKSSRFSSSPESSPTLWQLDEPYPLPFDLSPVNTPLVRPVFLPPEEPLSDSPPSYSTMSSSVPTPPSSPAPVALRSSRPKTRKFPHPAPGPPPAPLMSQAFFESFLHEPDNADFMGLDGCFSFSSPAPRTAKGKDDVAVLSRSPLAAGHIARLRRQEAKVSRRVEQFEWLERRLFGWVEDQRGRKVREVE